MYFLITKCRDKLPYFIKLKVMTIVKYHYYVADDFADAGYQIEASPKNLRWNIQRYLISVEDRSIIGGRWNFLEIQAKYVSMQSQFWLMKKMSQNACISKLKFIIMPCFTKSNLVFYTRYIFSLEHSTDVYKKNFDWKVINLIERIKIRVIYYSF